MAGIYDVSCGEVLYDNENVYNNKAVKEKIGYVADDTILYNLALGDSSVKILPKRYSQEPYAVAFRKEKESVRLIREVDYIIDNLKSTGKLNKMREKWNINRGF